MVLKRTLWAFLTLLFLTALALFNVHL
jgi:hypothetical protein